MFARTERLLLRPGWKEDAPALFQAICDERIVCNLANAPWPYSFADAESFLDRQPGGPLDARWLITLRTEASPRLIGCIGFGHDSDGSLEFGYWVARPYWGQGFATEAGKAVVDIARHGLRLKLLRAGHFIDNPASGRVLGKLGFRHFGTALRYSAGRAAETPCKLFELDLQTDSAEADPCAMAA